MAKNTVNKILSKKKLGFGGTVMLGVNTYAAISDYKQSRLEGHGKVGSAISAAGTVIVGEALGWHMLTLGALKAVPSIAANSVMKVNSMARSMDRASRNTPFINSTFVDSQQAFTMRQAGMQMAQTSKYNLQQALMGNEASAMHKI